MAGRARPIEERFWNKVDTGATGGCWLWTGAKNEKGYGVIGRGGRGSGNEKAHRVSWMIHFGPIPDGLFVCHKCDNPACVNPDHLFLGTNDDNVQDMVSKNRNARGETSYAKLTEEQVIDIRQRHKQREVSCQDLANEYGVSRSEVQLIVSGKRWEHVESA